MGEYVLEAGAFQALAAHEVQGMLNEGIHGHGCLLAGAVAHGYGLLLGLAATHDKDQRDLPGHGRADLGVSRASLASTSTRKPASNATSRTL